MKMPSRSYLHSQLHQRFVLCDAAHHSMRVNLLRVTEGVAMDPRFESFSIAFVLPSGARLPSGVYALSREGESEAEWPLLLTPIAPGEDGCHLMEAVFHLRVDVGDTQTARAA